MDKFKGWEENCTYCIHDAECAEIGGRQEGRGYGVECMFPDVEPRFEPIKPEERAKAEAAVNEAIEEAIADGLVNGLDIFSEEPGLTPGSPEACPENGGGCDECDWYQECYPDWRELG